MVSVSKSKSTVSGYAVRLFFSVCQDKRDSELMSNLVNYLSCGGWYERDSKSYGEFIVSKFSDIESKIIPFCTSSSIVLYVFWKIPYVWR